MRKIALVTLLLVLTAVNGTIIARPPSNVVVTSTIADADSVFMPLSIQSDLIGSYLNGTSSVVSQIQGIGDWELDMLGSATRRVNVNFNDLVAGSNPDPINRPTPMSGYHPVRFITQCTGYGYNLLNLTSVGQTATCGLIVAVNIGTDRYSLRFHPRYFAGSNTISVACTAIDTSNKCRGWRTQSPNGAGKLIARVQKATTVRGKQVYTEYGNYRFSFDMSFSNP